MFYVIVHANCRDGFTAAWVAKKALGSDCKIIQSVHSSPPFDSIPTFECEKVLLFDICFARDVMVAARERFGSKLEVHDHHKSARDEMADLSFCSFDMNRSGAMLAWDYFFPGDKAPWLVEYVQDTDLWTKCLPYTDEISAMISSVPKTMANWDMLSEMPWDELLTRGKGAKAYLDNYVDEIIVNYVDFITWQGYKTAVVNAPYFGISDLLAEILKRYPAIKVAMGWSMDAKGKYRYSLRARKGEVDVSVICQKYGGGGHAAAAGFAADRIVF